MRKLNQLNMRSNNSLRKSWQPSELGTTGLTLNHGIGNLRRISKQESLMHPLNERSKSTMQVGRLSFESPRLIFGLVIRRFRRPSKRRPIKHLTFSNQTPNIRRFISRRLSRFRSVRVGLHHRALAVDTSNGLLWFWIGSHAEYDKFISK